MDQNKFSARNPMYMSSVDGMSMSARRGSPRRDFANSSSVSRSTPTRVPQNTAQPAMQPSQPRQTQALPQEPVPTASPSSSPAEAEETNLSFPLSMYDAPARPKRLVRKKGRVKKAVMHGAGLMMAGIFIAGGMFLWQGMNKVQGVFHGTSTVAALSSGPVAPELLRGEGDGRINILLLGVGGKEHDGGDLTDTIMLLSVDPVNNKAALVSVPRDLWVVSDNNRQTHTKINSLFSLGAQGARASANKTRDQQRATEAGFAAIDKAIGTVLGANVDYHAVVDFKAFQKAIDTVNGVTVTVKEPISDPMLAWENNNNARLFSTGTQTLSGKQALLYARSRYTTSDFSRNDRQREVLVAFKNKVATLKNVSNPATLSSLMHSFSDNAYSDLSPTGAVRLLNILKQIGSENITSINLAEGSKPLLTPTMIEGQSVVVPVAGVGAYADIQDFVRVQLQDGYLKKEAAPIYIVSNDLGKVDRATETLRGYGYSVTGGAKLDMPDVSQASLVDISGGAATYTKHYLETRYTEVGSEKLPTGISVPVGTKFVIMLP